MLRRMHPRQLLAGSRDWFRHCAAALAMRCRHCVQHLGTLRPLGMTWWRDVFVEAGR